MTYVQAEIASQPDCWTRAAELAVVLATSQGLDPDHPRNLTRSVVLI